ncbi:hypothetical protein [Hymenobacter swuensis]|uniref:Uncharacterized protein n=1 Tax=Hymenobacter swuensis DY53 TaxID=1227739 RepID=W8F1D8_9BACT|nr:hypothetical protein [Hymenobacter swuensis]AHJ98723.1 hypothetical protein Hsw_3128 [Hymenobacter swuensis DY53]
MKHLSGLLHKLTAVAAVAVALSSCNRAEYAMLPKTSSAYHGTQRAVAVTPAPITETTVTPVTTEVSTPAVPVPAAAAQAAPVAAEKSAVAAAPAKAAAPAPKLNFAQKALVAKLTKQANKLSAKAQVNKKSEVAAKEDANAISRNIKLGIILLLIGILVGLISGILGTVIAIIGIVFIVLGLLDEV